MSDEKKAPSEMVVSRKQKPCGCIMTEFADKRVEISPCVPCGLFAAGNNIAEAGNALCAVATRLKAENEQRAAISINNAASIAANHSSKKGPRRS
jgi:hypothetical protein